MLVPDKVNPPSPADDLVKLPLPLITPDNVAATPVSTFTTPPLNDKEMALSMLAPSPVTDNVPEFNVNTPEPRLESSVMDNPPPKTAVLPV